MDMLKYLLDNLEINILNIELYRVHQEWRHRGVNSPYSRIYLITDGRGTICHHGRTYTLQSGYLYLIPAFTTVDMDCPDTFEHYYIHLTTFLPDGVNLFSLVDCEYQIPAHASGIGRWIFDRLLELNPGLELIERDANKPIYESVLRRSEELNQTKTAAQLMETNALIRQILAAFLRTANPAGTDTALRGYSRFQRVLRFIHQNLHREIALVELADLADLSPAYFSHLFSRMMGAAPIEFINRRKMEQAQRLLLGTSKSLKEIAAEVGFGDVFYFSRLFRKITGTAPGQYRRQHVSS